MLLRMLGLHQLKGPGVIQSEYWGLTSQISKVFTSQSSRILPAGVLGVCFSSWSAGVFTSQSAEVCYQPECWSFTSWSAGILPAGVLGFYQPECWDFTSWSAEVFYQPECWSFTSQSARVLPAGVLGFFIQPERWGCYQPECRGYLRTSQNAGVLPAGLLRFYKP